MKVVVQNLQKRPALASKIVDEYDPDIFLVQEVSWSTEEAIFHENAVHATSRSGYGTAIYSKKGASSLPNVRRVESPHAEFGGLIHKKTTIASYGGGQVELVSFHGYNGQPFKNVENLKDHVGAVLSSLKNNGPAIFGGDFNTWTQTHIDEIETQLKTVNFHKVFSWPYPARQLPLDHVFTRYMKLLKASVYSNDSDHDGAVIELSFD